VYGAALSVEPTCVPSIFITTLVTVPVPLVTVAVTEAVPLIVAPFAGAEIATTGGVLTVAEATVNVFTGPEADCSFPLLHTALV
jgi:hypothetical protein